MSHPALSKHVEQLQATQDEATRLLGVRLGDDCDLSLSPSQRNAQVMKLNTPEQGCELDRNPRRYG